MPVYASTGDTNTSMIVSTSWLDEGLLRIDVLDAETGEISSLAIRLSDFISDATNSPYIMVQAADLDGNLSGIVHISNPFYDPYFHYNQPAEEMPVEDINGDYSEYDELPQLGLTPDGMGTVVDNITTQNEIEFFTVFTEDGHEFFLVVDRQRNVDNVYLLNAVTLNDLVALAHPDDNAGIGISAIPAPPTATPPIEEPPQPPPTPQPEPEPPAQNTSNNSNIIVILVVVAIVGGGAYYFKVVKGKNNGFDDEEDYEDDDFPFMEDTDEDGEEADTSEGSEDE